MFPVAPLADDELNIYNGEFVVLLLTLVVSTFSPFTYKSNVLFENTNVKKYVSIM